MNNFFKKNKFYFLIFLMVLNLGIPYVTADLYSRFNNKLDKVSNYAENRLKAVISPPVEMIYKDNGEYIKKKLDKIQKDSRENGKLKEIPGLVKLINVLSSYNDPSRLKMPRDLDYQKKRLKNNLRRRSTLNKKDSLKFYSPKVIKRKHYIKDHNYDSFSDRRTRTVLTSNCSKLYSNVSVNPSDITQINSLVAEDQNEQSKNIDPLLNVTPLNDLKTIIATGLPNPNTYIEIPNTLVDKGFEIKSSCLQDSEVNNVTKILESVLIELEALKKNNQDAIPNGIPCDIVGSWSSEIIGLGFNISLKDSKNDLLINLSNRYPVKRKTLMDTSWQCTGEAVKREGGPFYITGQNREKEEACTLATFAGMCKRCGDLDMIFGSWTFVYPAKDCHDVQIAIDTKRDVFHRDSLQSKKIARLKEIQKKN